MAEAIFTDATFDSDVLGSDVPVLVDFWAPWCGPCKMQGPIVEQLAHEFADKKFKIGKLNVDEAPQSASRYHIMSIPTLMIFKNGKPTEQMIGVQDKATIQRKIESYLSA